MRIGRVDHYVDDFCVGHTLVGIPDDKTNEDFERDVKTAVEEQEKAIERWKSITEPPRWSVPITDFPDDATIGQFRKAVAAHEIQWRAYGKAKNDAACNFMDFMVNLGYSYVESLDLPNTEAHWPHHDRNMSLTEGPRR